jgi:EmrB/QacA subfamily drug resistance transporter
MRSREEPQMRTRDAAAPASDDRPARRRWLALAALAAAQFMVFLDETVVNVALPSIKTDLGFAQATLGWVVSSYIVVFGGLVLAGGRAADLFGRRRMFLAGTAVFGVASLADGLAGSQQMLLGARVLQGIGAALATPTALALVTALFPVRAERAKALSIWGALSGLGFTAGILAGGAITEFASWRWVFLINVPVAAASLVVVPRLVAGGRTARRRGFDLGGAVTITAGMTTLVYALVKAPGYGWGSPAALALFAAAAGLLAAFAVIERRSAAPLIPAGFVHRRSALVPNVLQLLLGISGLSTLFLLTLYTQQVLGYTPLRAGAAYLPLAAGVAAASAIASRLVGRTGPRPLAIAGLATAAAGMTLLGHATPAAGYWAGLLPAVAVLGLGAGLSFVSITTAALERVDDAAAGLASGLLSTTVQLGGAVGITVLAGVVATWRGSGLLAAGATPLAAQAGGLRLGFLLAAAVSLAAALVAAFALQRGTAGAPAGAPAAAAPEVAA